MAFLSSVGVLAAPLVHRFLHRFHLEQHERAGRALRDSLPMTFDAFHLAARR